MTRQKWQQKIIIALKLYIIITVSHIDEKRYDHVKSTDTSQTGQFNYLIIETEYSDGA